MKNKIFKGIVASILLFLCSFEIYGQSQFAVSWSLNGTTPPIDNNQTYDFVGRDSVKLKPGFNYKPDAGKSFRGRIDETQVFDITYESQQPGERTIDMGLQVGAIQGNGSVSSMGGALYNIPIESPQGVNGLMPSLSISYNSQSGNGIIGWGWHLNGLSSITRVSKTIYHNGYNYGVSFENDDYAIDGNRIIIGSDEEYHTEVESFSKITINGTYSTPTSFRVETKSGLIYEYNYAVTAGTATIQWLLSKILDPRGNFIQFNYAQENCVAWPVSIDYAGNSIKFIYEKREDITTGYINGAVAEQSKILKKIRTTAENSLFREYEFKYFKASTEVYSKLVEVTLKGSNNQQCNSTLINWHPSTSSGLLSSTINNSSSVDVIIGDYNGDGKSEILQIGDYGEYTIYNYNNGWEIERTGALWDPSNGMGLYTNGMHTTSYTQNFGDIDKDGKDDIVIQRKLEEYSSHYFMFMYLSSEEDTIEHECFGIGPNPAYIQAANFNGDDITDLLIYGSSPYPEWDSITQTYRYINYLYFGDGINQAIINNIDLTDVRCMDVNGDGLTDVFLYNSNTNQYRVVGFNIENPWSLVDIISTTTADLNNIFEGDFNGDEKMDIFSLEGSNNYYSLYVSTGTSFNHLNNIVTQLTSGITVRAAADFNGDGIYDILYQESDNSMHILFGPYQINESGSLVFTKKDYGTDPVNSFTRIGDFNGDGQADLLTKSSTDYLALALFNSNDKSHLVSQVRNGFNNTIGFEYENLLTGTSVYTNDYTATYPLRTLNTPLYVVSEMESTNGNGSGNLSSTYSYKNLVANMQGKGILGFKETFSSSPVTSTHNIFEIKNDTVCLMRPYTIEVSTANDDNISSKTLTYAPIVDNGNKSYYQYVSDISESHFEHGNVSYHYAYDVLGNITIENVDYSGGDAVHTSYSGYTTSGAWCATKPTTVSVTKTVGGNSYTLASSYTYENGQMLTKSANDVTVTYTYNTLGNATRIETTGAGKTLTEDYVYDSKGKFVLSKSDALGTTKYEYYNPYGLVNKITDINNLVTTISYDGFGRPKRKNLPDGNSVNYNYAFYNTEPAEYFVLESQSGMPSVKTKYNMFGKSLGTETDGFNGALIKTENTYNTLGQLEYKYKPFTTSQGDHWHYTYDDFGRLYTESTPEGDEISYTYSGLQASLVSTAKGSFSKTANHFGQALSVTENSISTSYTYFGHGGINTITPPGTSVSMTYNSRGQQATLVDPDAGSVSYTYNALGLLESQTETGRSVTTNMQYDLAGRCTTKTVGGITYNYTYDTEFKGALSSVIASNGSSEAFKYNKYGDLLEKTSVADGQIFTTKFEYNSNHQPVKKTYPSDFAITYTYGNFGYLSEINKATGGLIWKADAMNAMMQVTQYESGANIVTNNTFNHDFLTSIQSVEGSNIIHDMGFVWDSDKGNLSSRTDWQDFTETFGYDAMQRCTSAVYVNSETMNVISDLSMSYLSNGNMQSKSDAGTFAYEGNEPHAITKVTNYTSAISTVQQNVSYNFLNKVDTIGEGDNYMKFYYGVNQERSKVVYKNAGVLQYTKYYAGDYEKVVPASGTAKEYHYISAPSGLVAVYVKDGVDNPLYYTFSDHLGSITTIANETGNVLQRLHYDMWGKRSIDWNASGYDAYIFERGFTGHEHLEVFNLINMNGRLYDPVLGRFLSPDNYVQGDGSQGFNRYAYCLNNPLKYTDPTGNGWQYLYASSSWYWVPGDCDNGTNYNTMLTYGASAGYSMNDFTPSGYQGGGVPIGGSAFTHPLDLPSLNPTVSFMGMSYYKSDAQTYNFIIHGGSYFGYEESGVPIQQNGVNGNFWVDQYSVTLPGWLFKGIEYLKNVGTAFSMFNDWAMGTGPETRTFYNDRVTNAMKNAWQVNEARNRFYNKYKGVPDLKGAYYTNHKGKFGIEGLFRAGLDPIEQFVGSFRADIYSNGKELIFDVSNPTSMKSLLYGIAPDWPRSTWGPGGNMFQHYIWKEPLILNKVAP